MDKSFISLLVSSIILLLTLSGVAWYKNKQNQPLEITAMATIDDKCNLNVKSCQSTVIGMGKIDFSILPKPIPLVSDISLSVKTDLKNIKQVLVDFEGVDMKMGPNKVTLIKQDNGEYKGTGMLPICIRYRMHWQASVYIETSEGLYMAPYIFETTKK